MIITPPFQQCFTHYIALRMSNSMRINTNIAENASNEHNIVAAVLCNHELTHCIFCKENCNIKENKSKSMMHILFILWLVIKHILGQSNIKQVLPLLGYTGFAFTRVYRLCLYLGIQALPLPIHKQR